MVWRWSVRAADGTQIEATPEFGSRPEAEEWLGSHYDELLDAGGDNVVLLNGTEAVYEMGLHPA